MLGNSDHFAAETIKTVRKSAAFFPGHKQNVLYTIYTHQNLDHNVQTLEDDWVEKTI